MDFAKQWGASINWVPVKADKGYDLSEIENRISKKTKLIFLCNPNNPTGTLIPSKKLYDFNETAANKTIVFSDEAYYDYIEDPNYPSMIDLIKKNKKRNRFKNIFQSLWNGRIESWVFNCKT